ncbi:MAG: hypothetical protein ACLPV8_02680 [Steroidobacteraceae bacterium]
MDQYCAGGSGTWSETRSATGAIVAAAYVVTSLMLGYIAVMFGLKVGEQGH